MKKNILFMGLLAMGLCLSVTSCSDDDDDKQPEFGYTSEYADNWGKYAFNVASDIKIFTDDIEQSWSNSYSNELKNKRNPKITVDDMLDGCEDLVDDLADEKLRRAECEYSGRTKTAYKNNVKSIANVLLGVCLSESESLTEETATKKASVNSLYTVCVNKNARLSAAMTELWSKTVDVWDAINAVPEPFADNMKTSKMKTACTNLAESFEVLEIYLSNNIETEEYQQIVDQFVDYVAIPTYVNLSDKSDDLLTSSLSLSKGTNSVFSSACKAWNAIRYYWEISEAIDFGPVEKGNYDDKLNTWPVNESRIRDILKSKEMNSNTINTIKNTTNLSGFHALEYLLFENGAPRTVK